MRPADGSATELLVRAGWHVGRLPDVVDRLTVLTVHAHPDDEASKGAPTMAKYHAAGVRTVLVCCTGGEEGDLQNPSLREPGQPLHGLTPEEVKAAVTAMRPAELARSAEIIGFDEVVMLGYRDSGMPDTPPNTDPRSFFQTPIDDSTGRLVEVIRRTKPQVLVTYGDDQTGYPHPDHLRVHDISVLAFDRAGDPDWYPQAGEPFQPLKLYYSHWSMKRMRAVHDALVAKLGYSPFDGRRRGDDTDTRRGDDSAVNGGDDTAGDGGDDIGHQPIDQEQQEAIAEEADLGDTPSTTPTDAEEDEDAGRSWFDRPDNDHRITTRIDVTDYLWARTGALMAHATQVDPTEAFWFGLTEDELAAVSPTEDWVLARSLVGPIPIAEDDLFAGISVGQQSR